MRYLSSTFLALLAFNGFVWYWIGAGGVSDDLNLYFLDVGQGDSELIDLPYGRQILIDGGPDGKVLDSLAKTMPPTDRYLDAVIVTHPQLDHFNGLIGVLQKYRVGVFLYNGRSGNTPQWRALRALVKTKKIPTVVLGEGDSIESQAVKLVVLSPDAGALASKELNDTALVAELEGEGARILFTSDIGSNIEAKIINRMTSPIDVLKVAHHGSKYSSSADFIKAAEPGFSIIEVGKNNYGHPTKEALANLLSAGSEIYRTDRDGNIHLEFNGGLMKVFKER